jgi:hypothetical protein
MHGHRVHLLSGRFRHLGEAELPPLDDTETIWCGIWYAGARLSLGPAGTEQELQRISVWASNTSAPEYDC